MHAIVQGADAVLAVRPEVTRGSWLREAAKAANVPVFSVKSQTPTDLIRALRTMLGIDPSPGALFAPAGDMAAVVRADPANKDASKWTAGRMITAPQQQADGASQQDVIQNGSLHHRTIEEQATARSANSHVAQAALLEVHDAVELLVSPLQQPVELRPQPRHIIDLQVH